MFEGDVVSNVDAADVRDDFWLVKKIWLGYEVRISISVS
jgi:hypothetical protein